VYTTTFRGPTYTYLATLRTLEPANKWTLAGVAIIMQEDD
jgi:dynein heavy chain